MPAKSNAAWLQQFKSYWRPQSAALRDSDVSALLLLTIRTVFPRAFQRPAASEKQNIPDFHVKERSFTCCRVHHHSVSCSTSELLRYVHIHVELKQKQLWVMPSHERLHFPVKSILRWEPIHHSEYRWERHSGKRLVCSETSRAQIVGRKCRKAHQKKFVNQHNSQISTRRRCGDIASSFIFSWSHSEIDLHTSRWRQNCRIFRSRDSKWWQSHSVPSGTGWRIVRTTNFNDDWHPFLYKQNYRHDDLDNAFDIDNETSDKQQPFWISLSRCELAQQSSSIPSQTFSLFISLP